MEWNWNIKYQSFQCKWLFVKKLQVLLIKLSFTEEVERILYS